jgi:hypothetical protein
MQCKLTQGTLSIRSTMLSPGRAPLTRREPGDVLAADTLRRPKAELAAIIAGSARGSASNTLARSPLVRLEDGGGVEVRAKGSSVVGSTFWSLKSSTPRSQTAQRISFSPTMLRALVKHAEHKGCPQGDNTATRVAGTSHTLHADADLGSGSRMSSSYSVNTGPFSEIEERDRLKGSLKESGIGWMPAAKEWGYGAKSSSSISKSCSGT